MFQFTGCPSSYEDDSTTAAGFPHSEICGSMVTCTSPQLIAAYRVLRRLIWPRHPPYALTYLTFVSRFVIAYVLTFLEYLGSLSSSFLFEKRFISTFYAVVKVRLRDDLSKLNNVSLFAIVPT